MVARNLNIKLGGIYIDDTNNGHVTMPEMIGGIYQMLQSYSM